MYVAGYTFHVLNNAFTNHWGFQSISTRPAWRVRQQEANEAKFDEFAKEVSTIEDCLIKFCDRRTQFSQAIIYVCRI